MKQLRFGMLVLAALALVGFAGNVNAFHSGGVAECGGCHSMHDPAPNGSYLLLGTDQSSACLTCHQNSADTGPSSYHVSTASGSLGAGQAPLQRSPGGDFGWIKKDYTFVVRGSTINEDGDTHGHNIIAADFGYAVDSVNANAPGGLGGGFPSSALGCQSCHDPHGQYRRLLGNVISKTGGPIKGSGSYPAASNEPDATNAVGVYRLLAGPGYVQDGVTFLGVPAAKVPSTYNRTEASTQTRVAYGHSNTSGQISWGDWCATCHQEMHSNSNYVHPVDDTLGGTVSQNYGLYVKTGDMTGDPAASFTSLVPFVTNSSDYTVLAGLAVNDNSRLGGPSSSDRVSCVSCHRAHASGWEYALRWNMEGEFMTYNGLYPGTDNGSPAQFARGRTAAETMAAYYDRPVTVFAAYQRVLCNKCHYKD